MYRSFSLEQNNNNSESFTLNKTEKPGHDEPASGNNSDEDSRSSGFSDDRPDFFNPPEDEDNVADIKPCDPKLRQLR